MFRLREKDSLKRIAPASRPSHFLGLEEECLSNSGSRSYLENHLVPGRGSGTSALQ